MPKRKINQEVRNVLENHKAKHASFIKQVNSDHFVMARYRLDHINNVIKKEGFKRAERLFSHELRVRNKGLTGLDKEIENLTELLDVDPEELKRSLSCRYI